MAKECAKCGNKGRLYCLHPALPKPYMTVAFPEGRTPEWCPINKAQNRKGNSKFLVFDGLPDSISGTLVKNTKGALLGAVTWYPPWRKMVFEAVEDRIFDAVCLRDIADFCEQHTKAKNLCEKIS